MVGRPGAGTGSTSAREHGGADLDTEAAGDVSDVLSRDHGDPDDPLQELASRWYPLAACETARAFT